MRIDSDVYQHLMGEDASARYLPKFAKFAADGSPIGWNWACFFFGGFWIFYRQLYGLLAVYLILLSAAANVLTAAAGTALAFLPFYAVVAKLIWPAFVDYYLFRRINGFIHGSRHDGIDPTDFSSKNRFASIGHEAPNNPNIF